MLFESNRQEQEWKDERLSPLLKEIITFAENYAFVLSGCEWEFRITSIYRTPEENKAAKAKTTIHTVWRAVDVGAKEAPTDCIHEVTDWVNENYVYDPYRPAMRVAYSEPHGTGPHIHFQIHPFSKKRV